MLHGQYSLAGRQILTIGLNSVKLTYQKRICRSARSRDQATRGRATGNDQARIGAPTPPQDIDKVESRGRAEMIVEIDGDFRFVGLSTGLVAPAPVVAHFDFVHCQLG
jgi:hypothetical protein